MKSFVWVLVLLVCGRAWGQDGTLDTTFREQTDGVVALAVQDDGKIIVGIRAHGIANIYRLNNDGSTDYNFFASTLTTTPISQAAITSIVVQPDGKILVAGVFSYFNDTSCQEIIRLHSNGLRDYSFHLQLGFTTQANWQISIQPNGKILVGGYQFNYAQNHWDNVRQYNSDGSRDTTFYVDPALITASIKLEILRDGKIYVSDNGYRVQRLYGDGRLDTTYNPCSRLSTGAALGADFNIQPDGKLLAGGDLRSVNSVTCKRLVRLNDNGSLDPTFNFTDTSLGYPYPALIQPDGKVLIISKNARLNRIVRIHADGHYDSSFVPITYRGNVVCLQSDWKIIVGGTFGIITNTFTYLGVVRYNNSRLMTSENKRNQEFLFELAPNPAHHSTTLTAAQPLQAVRVVGMDGKVVRVVPGGSGKVEVDLRGVVPGMYCVEGVGVEGRVSRQRLVVE